MGCRRKCVRSRTFGAQIFVCGNANIASGSAPLNASPLWIWSSTISSSSSRMQGTVISLARGKHGWTWPRYMAATRKPSSVSIIHLYTLSCKQYSQPLESGRCWSGSLRLRKGLSKRMLFVRFQSRIVIAPSASTNRASACPARHSPQ